MGTKADKTRRFLEHLEPLQGALEGFCRRWLHDQSHIEDVLQDTITVAFRDFHLFAEGTNFRAWIFRYVNLQVLGTNRKLQQQSTVPLDQEPLQEDHWRLEFDTDAFSTLLESPDQLLEHCDAPLAQSVRNLTPNERSVLLLKAIGGFKYREIAEILGCPMGTVMSTLSRARGRVRHELVEYAKKQGLLKTGTDDYEKSTQQSDPS